MTSTGVDRIQGIDPFVAWKAPVKTATTANITLSGAQTIDGTAVVEDDRVLVKNQTDASENGIYDVKDTAWVRADDFDGTRDVTQGTLIKVNTSVTYGNDVIWELTTSGTITIGTTSLSFRIVGGFSATSPVIHATTATMVADTSLAAGMYVQTIEHTSGYGYEGGNLYKIFASSQGTDDGGRYLDLDNGTFALGLFPNGANTKQWGAAGDGSNDDTALLQAALDSGLRLRGVAGVYKTTGEIVFAHGYRLIGDGNYSGVAGTFETTSTFTIRYAGAGGSNTCVVRIADEAVGTEPTTSSTRDMQNITCTNIVIDGGQLAEIGLYCVRAFSNNNLDNITVIKTKKYGFLALTCFNGTVRNWWAYKNEGSGITLGKDIFGTWTNAEAFDQNTLISFGGIFNGYSDSGSAYLNDFDEADQEKEYGLGYFGGRGTVFINANFFRNGGAGIYLGTTNSPPRFIGGYLELNGQSSGATYSYEIWLQGDAAADSWEVVFDGTHIGSGGKTPCIRLTGTEPSRVEHGPKFIGLDKISNVWADWDNYRLIDCNRSVTFLDSAASAATEPSKFQYSVAGLLNLNIIAASYFDATGGSIASESSEGCTVAYNTTGTYDVTLPTTFSSARFKVIPSTGDNRTIGVGNRSTSGFTLYNRSSGTLSDTNATISFVVLGYFI